MTKLIKLNFVAKFSFPPRYTSYFSFSKNADIWIEDINRYVYLVLFGYVSVNFISKNDALATLLWWKTWALKSKPHKSSMIKYLTIHPLVLMKSWIVALIQWLFTLELSQTWILLSTKSKKSDLNRLRIYKHWQDEFHLGC